MKKITDKGANPNWANRAGGGSLMAGNLKKKLPEFSDLMATRQKLQKRQVMVV